MVGYFNPMRSFGATVTKVKQTFVKVKFRLPPPPPPQEDVDDDMPTIKKNKSKKTLNEEEKEELLIPMEGQIEGVRYNKLMGRRFLKGDQVEIFVRQLNPLILAIDKKYIKPLLIFDIHGVLGDREPFVDGLAGRKRGRKFVTRPHCEEFLKYCFGHFEIAVWSSALPKNMNLPMFGVKKDGAGEGEGEEDEALTPLFVWSQREASVMFPIMSFKKPSKPLQLKELSKVWSNYPSYDASNSLLLDDDMEKSIKNPLGTLMLIPSFKLQSSKGRKCDEVFALDSALVGHLRALSSLSEEGSGNDDNNDEGKKSSQFDHYMCSRSGTDDFFPKTDDVISLQVRLRDAEILLKKQPETRRGPTHHFFDEHGRSDRHEFSDPYHLSNNSLHRRDDRNFFTLNDDGDDHRQCHPRHYHKGRRQFSRSRSPKRRTCSNARHRDFRYSHGEENWGYAREWDSMNCPNENYGRASDCNWRCGGIRESRYSSRTYEDSKKRYFHERGVENDSFDHRGRERGPRGHGGGNSRWHRSRSRDNR